MSSPEAQHLDRHLTDQTTQPGQGLGMHRFFTTKGVHPFDELEWEHRTAQITSEEGEVIFEQPDVEVPKSWSELATNVVASKYFTGPLGTPKRESSVKQLISRVAKTLADWGRKDWYFASLEDAEIFEAELEHLLVNQKLAFNSPVWFNVGVEAKPQCSACYILSVKDEMESILNLAKIEGMLFKGGSGTGSNLSTLRSSRERLSRGGWASGPVSFMRGFDAFAGVIKSGGKCFKAGTLIATPDGWKQIEALHIGDRVLTHEGPRAVADFMPNGVKQCYRVRAREGYEVEVTEGHKFAYWDASRGWFDVKPIEQFAPGDALYILPCPSEGGETIPLMVPEPIDPPQATTIVEMSFPSVLSGELAYVVGLMYGDGELRTEYPYRIRVAFGKNPADQDAAARFRAYCQRLFGQAPLLLEDCTGHQQIGFTRKRFVEFLVANGLAKGKAHALHFPCVFFRARPEVRAAFIAGVIDADGTYQERGGWSISSVDRAFLVDLQRLLLSLGIPSKIKLSRAQYGTWQPLYRLSVVGHTFIQNLVDYIAPHSSKVRFHYLPADGADKGWGYRPSLYASLVDRVDQRGGYRIIERTIGINETTGYGALLKLGTHPDVAVAEYAQTLSQCVQVTLESVEPTAIAQTYDIEVENVHLLSANGFYASNTRRAAKMVVLNIDHPDIVEFINCKAEEEKKAHTLIEAGYDGGFHVPGGAYDSIQFQNANHSIRVTDEFMKAVIEDEEWQSKAVTTGAVMGTYKARELMKMIAEAAWICGDPGIQFDTTTNNWHTCPNSGRINASNPCSEYTHLDDSACNLSSLNLMRFRRPGGEFDIEAFCHAVRISITAMEIIVDNAWYPMEKITETAKAFRQLGIGYANLGALLMARGIPYDSDEGRDYAAAITALLTGQGYRTSAEMAKERAGGMGPFPGYPENREPMLKVIQQHRAAIDRINPKHVPEELMEAVHQVWQEAYTIGLDYGYRNAQVSVLAPTGTISFLMDCDTTGVEPDLALVKYKMLVGGGLLKIVNRTVPEALKRLGYTEAQIQEIVKYLDEKETIEGAPSLKEEHLKVFDCAFKPINGIRSIHYTGHVRMMAAVQPFISGAISKCVTGDTLVVTHKGLMPIEKFYNEELPNSFKPLELDLASIDGMRQTDQFYFGGIQDIVRVELRDGRQIEATPNHRLYLASPQGLCWKRMDELEKGDYVAIKLGDRLWAREDVDLSPFNPSMPYGNQKTIRTPRRVTPDLAWFLGVYTAEGNITESNWTVAIHNNCLKVQERIRSIARELFGLVCEVRQERTVVSCKMTSKRLVEFLRFCGVGEGAENKKIPWSVLQSTEACVKAFVSGVYLDGYIPRNVSKVGFCVASKQLVHELQAVLSNFGILSSQIRKRVVEYEKDYFELNVFGRQAQLFVREFSFDEPEKQRRAHRLLQRTFAHSWADVVPCFDSRMAFVGAPRSVKARYENQAYGNPNTISWDTLRRLVEDPTVPTMDEMEVIVRNNIHFVPVRQITSGFRALVYDFSVPDVQAFVGNGIINHNTVNMPNESTTDDIMQTYIEAWKMGLKAIAIYRDGSKRTQPLSTGKKKETGQAESAKGPAFKPVRRRLPDERQSITHKFSIGGHEGYITVGMYEDGTPGEIFITMAKQGSVVSGLIDAFATMVSLALQYRVPLKVLVDKFSHSRFEPYGVTNNPKIRFAKSILDYIFRWLALKFLSPEEQRQYFSTVEATQEATAAQPTPQDISQAEIERREKQTFQAQADAPPCPDCGAIMVRNGSCYKCLNCGATSGCS